MRRVSSKRLRIDAAMRMSQSLLLSADEVIG
jgi:hypothetical protein